MSKIQELFNEIVAILENLQADLTSLHNSMEEAKEKYESTKNHIAKKYPEQIIEAIKEARSQGDDLNPIYQGEGLYKGHSLLYLIAHRLIAGSTAEILSYLRPEDIKRDFGAESELMIAIKAKNTEVINWLLENDPDLNYQKASGSAALHMSCMMKDYATTKRLLEKGANPNVINTYGCTPLFDVIIRVNEDAFNEKIMVDFLRLFKDYKADFNLKNNEGQTIFEQYLAPNNSIPFCKVDINYDKAALEILKLSQDIEIDLSKVYVGKFFMNIDNLKDMVKQDVDTTNKITTLCKLQKALIQFITSPKYLEQDNVTNTLSYIEEYDGYSSVKVNGHTYISIKVKNTGEQKSYTIDQLQSIIANKATEAAQFLYDNAHSIVQEVVDNEELDTMVSELTNPADIVPAAQLQIAEVTEEMKEDNVYEVAQDLTGVTLHADEQSDLS